MKYEVSNRLIELEKDNMTKALQKLEAKFKANHAKIASEAEEKLRKLRKQGVSIA